MIFYIQHFGNMCFSIHFDKKILVFDPHDGKSMSLPPPTIRNANIVLITHKHFDHNNGKDLVSNENTKILEETEGYFEIEGVKINGIKVKHGGIMGEDWGMTVIYSIQLPTGEIITHCGDLANIPTREQLNEILKFGRPDILIVPIGGRYMIGAKEAVEFSKIDIIRPNITTIGCHYLYGPLLTNKEFEGMTDEVPFLKLVKDRVFISNKVFNPYLNSKLLKEYMIMKPPILEK